MASFDYFVRFFCGTCSDNPF